MYILKLFIEVTGKNIEKVYLYKFNFMSRVKIYLWGYIAKRR